MMTLDKIAGVVFGTAIGDALGYPFEFQQAGWQSMPVKDLKPPYHYSDDTQMFRATCEGLLRAHGRGVVAAAQEIAEEYISWAKDPPGGHRAPGNACLMGCHNLELGVSWRHSGKPGGGGCGTAMRAMAYGLFLPVGIAGRWAAVHSYMTHRGRMAAASAAAVADGVAALLRGDSPVDAARVMIAAASRWESNTTRMLTDAMEAALYANAATSHEEAVRVDEMILDRWRGWIGLEAVAASLYCFLRNPESYQKSVLRAVNSPGDSDSLGAITGALSGAYIGAAMLPEGWKRLVERASELDNLSCRIYSRLS